MDNTFLAPPRRGRTRAVAVVVGLAIALGAVVLLVRAGHHDNRRASAVAEPTATTSHQAGAPATGQTPLHLVRGTQTVNGVPVGYPHTVTGAVSAAVEYTIQTGSTLDPQRAGQIGQAIADPSFGDAAGYFAQGPVNSRRFLGLPADGPVPAGASMTLGPVAYQIRDQRPDEVTVLLLGYLTTSTSSNGIQTRIGVFPLRLVWAGGDWKAAKRPAGADDYAELRVQPGSPQAAAAGWQTFTR